jgi:hypothetical protein
MIPWRIRQAIRWTEERTQDLWLSIITPKLPLPREIAAKRVIFVGASVGKAWRLHLVSPSIRTWAAYEFDKSPLVRRAIAARPDAILIKECAAYFPADGVDRDLVIRWVQQIRAGHIRPMLATVVPVTASHAVCFPGRAEALWEFNDWLRTFAAAEGVPLLDLEAALRVSGEDRHLQEHWAESDGLHLPGPTYRQHLDRLIPPLLIQAFRGG